MVGRARANHKESGLSAMLHPAHRSPGAWAERLVPTPAQFLEQAGTPERPGAGMQQLCDFLRWIKWEGKEQPARQGKARLLSQLTLHWH